MCILSQDIPSDAGVLKVNLLLKGMEKCKSNTIPEIKVYKDGVPTGTKKLYLLIEDLDFHNFPHGVKLIPYEDSDIVLQEKFKIVPLCPPKGSHQYRLTVRALDNEDKIVGYGQVTQQFPE